MNLVPWIHHRLGQPQDGLAIATLARWMPRWGICQDIPRVMWAPSR
jgi:hypothetical protein